MYLYLLGRPVMKTACIKIDVNNGTLSMEFDDKSIRFNIFQAIWYSNDINSRVEQVF